jgi:hypothetical protein
MSDDSNEPQWDASWLEENMREVEKDLESLELNFDNAEEDKALGGMLARADNAEENKAFDDMLAQTLKSLSEADIQLAEKIRLLARMPKMTQAHLNWHVRELIAEHVKIRRST